MVVVVVGVVTPVVWEPLDPPHGNGPNPPPGGGPTTGHPAPAHIMGLPPGCADIAIMGLSFI